MALTKACLVSSSLKNTGVDCDISMGPTAMIAAVPRTFTFTSTDFADPLTWFVKNSNEVPAKRIYPIFGNNAPVRFIANNKEADVIATLDDGAQVFVRYGFLNRMLTTTGGGIGLARSLQSFVGCGYRVLEFDKLGHMLARDNGDGTYSGLRCDFMYSPSPDLADFRNPWRTNFQVSFDPSEYVGNGIIFSGAQQLLDIDGLVTGRFVDAGPHSTTKLKVYIQSDPSGIDLVALIGTALNSATLWTVTNATTGAVITVTSVTQASGTQGQILEMNGTFTAATKYNIVGKDALTFYTSSVIGYDFPNPIQVTTP